MSSEFGGYKIAQGITYVVMLGDVILNSMIDTLDYKQLGNIVFYAICGYRRATAVRLYIRHHLHLRVCSLCRAHIFLRVLIVVCIGTMLTNTFLFRFDSFHYVAATGPILKTVLVLWLSCADTDCWDDCAHSFAPCRSLCRSH